MGLFKKKQQPTNTEVKCPVEGCTFTSRNPADMKKHTEWKHPELTQRAKKT